MKHSLDPFEVTVTPSLADSLEKYLALLLRWNQKINLVATSDLGELLGRHVGESMFGARLLPSPAGTLYDVGSGAGFPGLMLKLARPDWELVLVESDRRKAAFLSEAVRVLNLSGASVLAERFEQISMSEATSDLISARALGDYDNLLAWSRKALRPQGKVMLWLGSRDAERLGTTAGWSWDPPCPLPQSKERVLLVGMPSR